MIPTLETRLFNTLRKYPNSKTIRDLVEQGVDCNASYFDGYTRTFIYPIQLAAKIDRRVTLPYLYQHRNSPTKIQLEKHVIFYINRHQHAQAEKNDILFDYTVSRLLYTRISSEYPRKVFDTLIIALHDYDKAKYRGQSLCKGSLIGTFLQLRIYSLFRKLIDMKIDSDTSMFAIVEKELLNNLETFYFRIAIEYIPVVITSRMMSQTFSQIESSQPLLVKYYQCIAKNVVTKIEQLDINGEYTIAAGWVGHAVCVSFRRTSQTHIVIRIDNPGSQSAPGMHEMESSVNGWNRIRPRVLGQLHVDYLEANLRYFTSLIDSCTRDLSCDEGRSLIYNLNGRILHLEGIETNDVPSFDEQADANCVVKCFEPGMQIRFGRRYPKLYQDLLLYEQNTANLLVKRLEKEHRSQLNDIFDGFILLSKEEDAISLPVSEKIRLQDKLKTSYKQQYKHLLSHIHLDTRPQFNRKYVPLRIKNNNTSVELKNIFIKPRVLMLAEAGCGKTTVCEHITHLWATGKIWRDLYDWVFYIKMRNLNSERYPRQTNNYSLIDIIETECFSGGKLHHDLDKQKLINLFAQSSNILWILDGCDERMHTRHLSSIEKELLTKPNLLLTSRPYVTHDFQYDIQVQIQSFTPEDIEKYISDYFSFTLRSTGHECWSCIRFSEQLREIASIPACLEIICNLWENSKDKFDFGLTMIDVYQKMCKYLLERYLLKYHRLCHSALARRDIYHEPKAKPFAHLEQLAFKATKSHKFTTNGEEMNLVAGSLSPSVLHIGLLISKTRSSSSSQSVENIYHFVHRRFQEYLCARYMIRILESSDSNMQENKEVMEFITHEKYSRQVRDTFRLFFESERSTLCTDRFWSVVDNDQRDLVGLRHCSRIAGWFPRGKCMVPFEDQEKIEKRTTDAIETWISDSNRRAHDFGNKYLFEWFADVTGKGCWFTAWKEDLFVENSLQRRYFLPEVWSTENIDTLKMIYKNIPEKVRALHRLITSGPTMTSLRQLQLDSNLFIIDTSDDQTETSPFIRMAQEKAASRTPITTLADFAAILADYHSFASVNRRSEALGKETWRLKVVPSALEDMNNETLNLLLCASEHDSLFFRYFALPVISFVQLYANGNDLNDDILCSLIVLIAMSSECLLTASIGLTKSIRVEENETLHHIEMNEPRWTKLPDAFDCARNTYGYSSFFSTEKDDL